MPAEVRAGHADALPVGSDMADAVNPEARKLAESIITGQSAEVTQMKQMLSSLS